MVFIGEFFIPGSLSTLCFLFYFYDFIFYFIFFLSFSWERALCHSLSFVLFLFALSVWLCRLLNLLLSCSFVYLGVMFLPFSFTLCFFCFLSLTLISLPFCLLLSFLLFSIWHLCFAFWFFFSFSSSLLYLFIILSVWLCYLSVYLFTSQTLCFLGLYSVLLICGFMFSGLVLFLLMSLLSLKIFLLSLLSPWLSSI